MRVLHCIPSLLSGGAERQLSMLAPAQRALGLDVHVAYLRAGQHLAELDAAGVPLHRIHATSNFDPRIATRLSSLTNRLDPDVIHTWLTMMDLAAGSVALLQRRAWVMAERSSAAMYRLRFRDRVVRDRLGRFADKIVANSEGGRQLWLGKHRDPDHVTVVRNALQLDAIARTAPANLSDLGVPPQRPAVIFVGRLSSEKNIALLLEVALTVCGAADVEFLICGDGPLRAHTEAVVKESPAGERVKVLGQRTDVWALVKASRVFVSTSSFEGQPNAVLEAMACGCPLVLTDIPAHREFLDNDAAVLIPPTRDAFVTAILDALNGSPKTVSRVAVARQLMATLSPEHAARAYAEIYEETVKRRRACVES